ncbi:esterase/lipase family protein [Corynebacterium tapiri]|uniref:Alpha/beta fold hydrolase n=1 Tax=Corynebacterium tapiri TaxID=1448266 RepID=A0A5C4U1Y6_9CORY|nr:alpha/beta fold hydrolase [Corynebacterium tapiri]TNL96050.1 alpha/beta fold hydrolase [Corynebacterium tapiri]
MKKSTLFSRAARYTLAASTALLMAGSAAGTANAQESSGSSSALKPLDFPAIAGSPVNDTTCQVKEGQSPVLFLHGTGADANHFKDAYQVLAAEGYCTFTVNYGGAPGRIAYGWADLDASAQQVAEAVDHVKDVTGAPKVTLVGHSQGGTLTKKYIQQLGGAGNVDRVVSLGATYRGTDVNGGILREVFDTWPAFWDTLVSPASFQQVRSQGVVKPQISELMEHPDAAPGIVYTAVYTPKDTTATSTFATDSPYGKNDTSVVHGGEPGYVVNVNADEACGYAPIGRAHDSLPWNPVTVQLIKWGVQRDISETTPQCGAAGGASSGSSSSSVR